MKLIVHQAGELRLQAKINVENAAQIYTEGLNLIQQHNTFPLIINLSEMQQGSTLALAVFIQWLRHAPTPQSLHFKAVPDKMMKIIQACHLENDLIML